MNSRKKILKQELLKTCRNFSILLISLILIHYGWSISFILGWNSTDKESWSLDIGAFNLILSAIFSLIYFFYRLCKLHIVINIINKKENSNSITLVNQKNDQICVKIQIIGRRKKLAPIIIYFPDWLDVQVKRQSYIEFYQDENKCMIDLEQLITKQKNINQTRLITLDIINNTDDENAELIEAQCRMNWFQKLFQIEFDNCGINIKNK
ncbi:hypothetical protein [Sporolactobacillus terrae]|uniref:hypothetical protein n=1 Tax=Sporolactobacillus terrae TaxID=269673 RepID=UPI001CBBD53A|nr:hypothetical protein [Sporolactobacillus terrae]UAK17541.1 hypothetical protein K7399_06340 [Sporolactobacillus terrae]